jgi:hypothetical protein
MPVRHLERIEEMPRRKSLPARKLIVAMMIVSIATPAHTLFAAGPGPAPAPTQTAPVKLPTQDVELSADGMLRGYFVDGEQGAGRAGLKVTLHQNSVEPLASTVTGENGEFEFKDLRGGTYQVVVNDEHVMAYRAWTAGTAPPRTKPQAVFVAGEATRAGLWFAGLSPEAQLAILALIAAGIAIPIAIAANDDDGKRRNPEEGEEE